MGFPIPIVEPKQYRKPLFLQNSTAKDLADLFNKAHKLDSNGEKPKAIRWWKRYAAAYPNDLHVYSVLGNAYADIGDYKNAFQAFEKALEIIPIEPFITRNYIVALYENGQYYEG
ncbi:MAG: tetratricopeptide repeat protein, partial [Saprospiraceae bacterium]